MYIKVYGLPRGSRELKTLSMFKMHIFKHFMELTVDRKNHSRSVNYKFLIMFLSFGHSFNCTCCRSKSFMVSGVSIKFEVGSQFE